MDDLLTPKQRSAIQRAKRDPTLQRLLFEKAEGLEWYFPFKAAGFLNPDDIPPPVPAKEEGFVSIPPWPITNYLVATSVRLQEPANRTIAQEYLSFVRTTTLYAKNNGFGNYRVWWQFAKIIRALPADIVSIADIDVVDYWLDDKYERGIVAEELGEHWLSALLDDANSSSKALALGLFKTLYRIAIAEPDVARAKSKSIHLRFDSWHAKNITNKVAGRIGAILGVPAIAYLEQTLRSILDELQNDKWSTLWRPAIEEHEQNASREDAEDIIVDVLRDALAGYVTQQPVEGQERVLSLLKQPYVMLKRIAVYTIAKSFEELKGLTSEILVPDHFGPHLQHEMWHLLNSCYPSFDDQNKVVLRSLILALVELDDHGKPDRSATAYRRAVWLSAIKQYGDGLQLLYKQCIDILGREPEHPDFGSYMSVGWMREDNSPIPAERLVKLGVEELVVVLRSYEDPSVSGPAQQRALAKALRTLIKTEPSRYGEGLDHFVTLGPPYLYEIIEAYSELWVEKGELPWDELWDRLLAFCERAIDRPDDADSSKREGGVIATRDWVVGAVARLIQEGVKNDDHAFPAALLSKAEGILVRLLGRERGKQYQVDGDAMTIAINTPRGRCIESFISLSLRSCRVSDKVSREHEGVWARLEPVYDSEMRRASDDECEFVPLLASHLPNFLYMSKKWTMGHLPELFDKGMRAKWAYAMQGYSFVSNVYEQIYRFLSAGDHLIPALDDPLFKERVRDRLVENIAVAYFADFEGLDKPDGQLTRLLERGSSAEIGHLIWFVWSKRDNDTGPTRAKVFALWERVLTVIDLTTRDGHRIAGRLCEWLAFVDRVTEHNRTLIFKSLPHIEQSGSYDLLPNIARLSVSQPGEAYEIWKRALDVVIPTYPEEALKAALINIVRQGPEGRRNAADIASRYMRNGYDNAAAMLSKLEARLD